MVSWLVIYKILVAVGFVVGLSLIAEHISPKAAGIMAGFPLGAALSLFFIGIENGREFAAQGAIYTLGGLSASMVFVYCYYRISVKVRNWELWVSSVAAVIGFLFSAKLLSNLELGLPSAFLITAGCVCLFCYLFRNIKNVRVKRRVSFTATVLLVRAIIAALFILIVTGIAKWVGPNWAGILSAFPVTLFPLLVIVHIAYGREQVHTIIKNFPLGLGSLISYVTTVHFTYPALGVGLGTVCSFVVAILYLIAYTTFLNKILVRRV